MSLKIINLQITTQKQFRRGGEISFGSFCIVASAGVDCRMFLFLHCKETYDSTLC